MSRLLEVKNLAVSYASYAGEAKAVRGVNFTVEEGEALAIVGESGCGKSVTAKTVMGLIPTPPGIIDKDSEILWQGKNILDFSENEWASYRGKECAMIFQDALTSLNPTMNVGKQIAENLTIHKVCSKAEAAKRAVELLEMVGIPNPEKRASSYPHEFSGGMRQRVMIAMALACSPKLLIADEPTTALDVTIQAQIIRLIKKLQKETGSAVILITHDLGVVADVADNILVMYGGKIVERGSCRDIFYNFRHPYTSGLLGAVPRLDKENKQELTSIEGMPPDLINPPKGCPFSTRCEYCMNVCTEYEPPEYDFGGGHKASCWLHHEKAPKGDYPFEQGGQNG